MKKVSMGLTSDNLSFLGLNPAKNYLLIGRNNIEMIRFYFNLDVASVTTIEVTLAMIDENLLFIAGLRC